MPRPYREQGIHTYPFTAIVDQERLKRALLVNAVNPAVGGVLAEGPAGTGKSTAVRGLADLLPVIDVVADCPFSCSPAEPCVRCRERVEGGEELPVLRRRMRIVTLPLNATEDRVAGSIDVARALREGVKALEPGLLAGANRGVLYVDEVNLLDDHLTDILLDAAALGTNVVEREGVSLEHPARFLLVGTMNPEEGELRPQIADRIGLHVRVEAIAHAEGRAEVMRRREAFAADPGGFAADWAGEQETLAAGVASARDALPAVRASDALLRAIAALVLRVGVASHRADLTILECAKGLAALAGREEVGEEDLVDAAGLALGHRLQADPFEPAPEVDERRIRRVLEDVLETESAGKKGPGPATPGSRPS